MSRGGRDLQPLRPFLRPEGAEAKERRDRGCLSQRDGPGRCAGLGRARQPAAPGVRAGRGSGPGMARAPGSSDKEKRYCGVWALSRPRKNAVALGFSVGRA